MKVGKSLSRNEAGGWLDWKEYESLQTMVAVRDQLTLSAKGL
jgi:hypothetical protein